MATLGLRVPIAEACERDGGCRPAEECRDGVCVPRGPDECRSDAACPAGQVCVAGRCQGNFPDGTPVSDERGPEAVAPSTRVAFRTEGESVEVQQWSEALQGYETVCRTPCALRSPNGPQSFRVNGEEVRLTLDGRRVEHVVHNADRPDLWRLSASGLFFGILSQASGAATLAFHKLCYLGEDSDEPSSNARECSAAFLGPGISLILIGAVLIGVSSWGMTEYSLDTWDLEIGGEPVDPELAGSGPSGVALVPSFSVGPGPDGSTAWSLSLALSF